MQDLLIINLIYREWSKRLVHPRHLIRRLSLGQRLESDRRVNLREVVVDMLDVRREIIIEEENRISTDI